MDRKVLEKSVLQEPRRLNEVRIKVQGGDKSKLVGENFAVKQLSPASYNTEKSDQDLHSAHQWQSAHRMPVSFGLGGPGVTRTQVEFYCI